MNGEEIRVRMIGKVIEVATDDSHVQWEDGTVERIPLDKATEDLKRFGAGQNFEAMAVRADGFALVRLESVKPAEPPPTMTPEQFGRLIASIPTTKTLPDTDWE